MKLDNIKPGQKIVYYTGKTPSVFLIDGPDELLVTPKIKEQAALFRKARQLYLDGRADLFQRKITDCSASTTQNEFEYLVIGRGEDA